MKVRHFYGGVENCVWTLCFSNTFNNQLKWKYNWKFDQNSSQTTITVQSVYQFSSSVRCFVFLSSETIIERGALQYVIKPFLYCDLFKASARAKKKKKKRKTFSLRVMSKYRPLFWRTNFQTIWSRKEEKSLTNYCQSNRTLGLCYAILLFVFKEQLRTRIVQLISINIHFNIYIKLIESSSSNYFHRKIGFSSSGLFIN